MNEQTVLAWNRLSPEAQAAAEALIADGMGRRVRVYETPDDRVPCGWRAVVTTAQSGQNNWPGVELDFAPGQLPCHSLYEAAQLSR